MKRLKAYIHDRIYAIVCYVLVLLIFISVFALSHITLSMFYYPLILCLVCGLIFFIFGYRSYSAKCAETERLQKELEDEIEELRKVRNVNLKRQDEMMSYYTTWVHQIKTPIASMRLILQGAELPEYRKITYELGRIESYVEMVLTYLRLGSDSTDYVIKKQELDPILRGAIRKFASEFITKKIRLNFEETEMTVLTDDKWLQFVVEQILSNALKYTQSGEIAIYAEAGNILCIRDTGIGIEAEDLPRIFEWGFTGFNGRMDKKASGIGLYLCKRICEKLGHSLSAQSVVGEGTLIRINLETKKLEVE